MVGGLASYKSQHGAKRWSVLNLYFYCLLLNLGTYCQYHKYFNIFLTDILDNGYPMPPLSQSCLHHFSPTQNVVFVT